MPANTPQHAVSKSTTTTSKATNIKGKEMPMSPNAPVPAPSGDSAELLGSLTTQQQQRTSARVIKKLRLDDAALDSKKDTTECDLPKLREEEKDPLKLSTVKQRMPKAIWLTDEKNLFFEALNEYGKDFDAITAHICSKMKKKGVPDAMLKTKNQVSHFYYRTWHKLSKHVHFDENVKKVAQELYALINYGELRKKLSSVNEKTCARLGEMVSTGSLVVRARGRNLRVRTPMCRALRRLNHITERLSGSRVCSRLEVCLKARRSADWARVQAAAHNPRTTAAMPLRARLDAFLSALEARWTPATSLKKINACKVKFEEIHTEDSVQEPGKHNGTHDDKENHDVDDGNHLNLEVDRTIVQEQSLPKKLALHVGPSPKTTIHLPTLSVSEHPSSQKICFSSYLERMCTREGPQPKIRTPKRQRKDSTTEKDKEQIETKKLKADEVEPKLMDIDETAIDGIELIANLKNNQEDEEKPSTEDEKYKPDLEDLEEERDGQFRDNVCERDKDLSEKEKDSFSEMEDDEKYNKSDTDNESDHGKAEKNEVERKFTNLKVKFRIRPKKRGGSIYTLITDDQVKDQDDQIKPQEDQVKVEDVQKPEEHEKADIDVDFVTRQIRKGWSKYDAGQLTIGDLYLMFGSRSRIELEYWWSEPSPPIPQPLAQRHKAADVEKLPITEKDKLSEKKEKPEKTPEKGTDSSIEDDKEKRDSDADIFSPKNADNQDSNDGLSGDERKMEQLLSPEHKCGTLRLTSKLVNKPDGNNSTQQHNLAIMSDRLKRLLALAGNPHILTSAGSTAYSNSKCICNTACPQHKKKPIENQVAISPQNLTETAAQVFRHPTPIAPKPDSQLTKPFSATGLPSRRRGRPRTADRVIVQRLLPLLPKLPPISVVPVKLVPNPPTQLPKLMPKPPPYVTSSKDFSNVYVLSETEGKFYFHDGDRKIPIVLTDDEDPKDSETDESVKTEAQETTEQNEPASEGAIKDEGKAPADDIANFLPTESMSLSPSRLLRESEGAWLEGAVHDFSLSSFLGHLEGRPQPDPAVDSQLQSLMVESSVDYVAKFADLAAEVTNENDNLTTDPSLRSLDEP